MGSLANSSLIGAVSGAIVSFLYQQYFRKIDNKNKEKHYASMLYYDLRSIENYVLKESSSVDIRYSVDWQHLVANCSFLKSEHVDTIYNIYDLVYNFDSQFNKYKEQGMSNRKEDQPSYKNLQELLSNTTNSNYDDIKQLLQNKAKINET